MQIGINIGVPSALRKASAPTISNTVLLLHFDGTDGSTSIIDSSQNAFTPTQRNGTCEIDTAQSVFGGSSLNIGGAGGIRWAASESLGIGTEDFRIQFRVRFATLSGNQTVCSQLTGAASNTPHIYMGANTLRYYVSGADRITSAAISADTWYAFEVSRVAGVTRMFLDGTQTGSSWTDSTDYGASQQIALGDYNAPLSGGSTFQGWFDEFRFQIGEGTATAYTPANAPFTS